MDDSSGDHEDRWRALAEHQIREAIKAGEFDNLPGMGQSVSVNDNPFVPEDWRLAFKVLENAGVVPDWITLAQEIEADTATWRRMADEHFALLRARLAAVASTPGAIRRLREEVANLKAIHRRATERHAIQLQDINRKIRYFNATVPLDSLLRATYDQDAEMRAWEDRLPAYLNY
jgi:hypothetical protein